MTCRELAAIATQHEEGGLPLPDRLRLLLHLGACRHCRAHLRQVRSLARALGMLPPPEIPPGVREALLLRYQSWLRR